MDFKVKGRRYSLTKQDVEQRLRDIDPEPVTVHGVVVSGRLYPVKQALAEALGIDKLTFNTSQAHDIFTRLGFELVRRSG